MGTARASCHGSKPIDGMAAQIILESWLNAPQNADLLAGDL